MSLCVQGMEDQEYDLLPNEHIRTGIEIGFCKKGIKSLKEVHFRGENGNGPRGGQLLCWFSPRY